MPSPAAGYLPALALITVPSHAGLGRACSPISCESAAWPSLALFWSATAKRRSAGCSAGLVGLLRACGGKPTCAAMLKSSSAGRSALLAAGGLGCSTLPRSPGARWPAKSSRRAAIVAELRWELTELSLLCMLLHGAAHVSVS